MISSSVSYFQTKFNNTTPEIRVHFENYFQLSGMSFVVIFSFISTILAKHVQIHYIIWCTHAIRFPLFCVITALTKINTDDWAMDFFILTIITICFFCASGSVFNSSTAALSSMMSPLLVKRTLLGESLAGLITTIIQLTTVSLSTTDPIQTGFYYFSIATVLYTASIVLFFVFMKNKYVRYYTDVSPTRRSGSIDCSGRQKLSFRQLMPKVIKFNLSSFFIACVNAMMYPAVLSLLQSSHANSTWGDKYFLLVCVFLVYNVGNFSGKITSLF